MILTEFSKYLQENDKEIVSAKITCTRLLGLWVKTIIERQPKTHVEKIIHKEITLATNKAGDFLLVAKSESGQLLTQSLYNFALSYEQHLLQKWLSDKSADDFNK